MLSTACVNLTTLFILSVSGHRSSCLCPSYWWSLEGQGQTWGPDVLKALSQRLASRPSYNNKDWKDVGQSQYWDIYIDRLCANYFEFMIKIYEG